MTQRRRDDIASKANGDEPQSRQLFPGKQFDYRVLKSKAVSDVSRYCVGALKDGTSWTACVFDKLTGCSLQESYT